ncbi:MAG: glycosyltransferase, partial [Pseudobutyrivibrio sp.]|nr:glycosyltransferase [Pseudobutyrivibrio sp.]
ILNNHKDEKLIIDEGVDPTKIFVWAPFFQSFLDVPRKDEIGHTLVFYGGMARQENYLSAIWFIEKVMPLLEDTDVKLQIVGANPDKSLFKYESDRVEIVGFAERVEDYLSKGMCLVAPLVLGAGVKIKVIESMSAGLPVLTNKIGIEGIPAEDKKDFFFCETPEEYADVIRGMLSGQYDVAEISRNSKAFIEEYFNYEKSAKQFAELLHQLAGEA